MNTITFPVTVDSFARHNDVKTLLLEEIDQAVVNEKYRVYNAITRTDWQVKEQSRYFDLIKSDISALLNKSFKPYGLTVELAQHWFQQYLRHDTHPWHTHGACNLSTVYYLELPEATATEFIDPISQQIMTFDVSEGDVITFPSLLVHRSPVNRTNQRKTVISINSNVNTILHN
jgi:hypothetical protein